MAVFLFSILLGSPLGSVVHDRAEAGKNGDQSRWKNRCWYFQASLMQGVPLRASKIVEAVWQIISEVQEVNTGLYFACPHAMIVSCTEQSTVVRMPHVGILVGRLDECMSPPMSAKPVLERDTWRHCHLDTLDRPKQVRVQLCWCSGFQSTPNTHLMMMPRGGILRSSTHFLARSVSNKDGILRMPTICYVLSGARDRVVRVLLPTFHVQPMTGEMDTVVEHNTCHCVGLYASVMYALLAASWEAFSHCYQ